MFYLKEKIRVFVACNNSEIIGFMSIQDEAEYLTAGCETLNPNALRFWGKHFKNYMYSYHRRMDERVIGYDSYLEKEWGVR